MGQAKLRGTKEQRVQQAIDANAERLVAQKAAQARLESAERERVAAMPAKEREIYLADRRSTLMRQTELLALSVLLGGLAVVPGRKE